MDDIRYQGQVNDQDQDTQSLSVQSDTAYDRDDDELAGLIAVAGNASPILPDSNSLSRRLAMFCDEAFIRKIAEQLESNERPIPRMIGQLEILDSLGKGGMGQVFRARHVKLNKIQAVKVLLAHRLDSPEAVSRFDQEIQAIGRLEHPNIVAAHDAGNQDGVPYLVMDYVNGSSLHTIVRDLQ